jgi:hypothetical protein
MPCSGPRPLETMRVDSGCIGLVDQTGDGFGCPHSTLVKFRGMFAPVISCHLTRRLRFYSASIHDPGRMVDLRLLAANGRNQLRQDRLRRVPTQLSPLCSRDSGLGWDRAVPDSTPCDEPGVPTGGPLRGAPMGMV